MGCFKCKKKKSPKNKPSIKNNTNWAFDDGIDVTVEIETVVPDVVCEDKAAFFSADGSEKLMVAPDALAVASTGALAFAGAGGGGGGGGGGCGGGGGGGKVRDDIFESREMMKELQKSILDLKSCNNIGIDAAKVCVWTGCGHVFA